MEARDGWRGTIARLVTAEPQPYSIEMIACLSLDKAWFTWAVVPCILHSKLHYCGTHCSSSSLHLLQD